MLYLQSSFLSELSRCVDAATSPESEISLYHLMTLVTRLGGKKNVPFSRKCQSPSHIWFGPDFVEASLTEKNAFLI